MRLRPHELERHLGQGLAPVYLISGDEPLQLGEAADAIRAAARAAGFTSRELLEADKGFDWGRLASEASALSLFAERRIIDLRLPSGKPGREGAATLADYCAAPPDDTLLLLTLPKLERSQLTTKWLKAIDAVGVVLQIWPIEGERLLPWIERRMRRAGLTPEPGVVALLAERVEGNLLAARQEIEKLLLLNGPGVLGSEQLLEAASDSARFDVFQLVDAALAGEAARCVRMLAGLRAEGLAAPVVLWALAREIRSMAGLAVAVAAGRSPDQAMSAARVWDKRKGPIRQGLQRLGPGAWQSLLVRCQRADAAIKGAGDEDPWQLLEEITLAMAGVRIRRRVA